MNRRGFLGVVAVSCTGALAGCFGASGNEEMAANAAGTVDDELGVEEWDADEDGFHIEFYASENPGFDITVVSGAYAGAVDDGLDVSAFAYALDENGDDVYWFEIEPEWAAAFMDDEISEDEYHDRIIATIR